MSTENNKAIMHELFDGVWNKEDYTLIDKYVSEDFIQHQFGENSGREGFRETVKKYHSSFNEMDLRIEDEIAEGDKVVHRFVWTCKQVGAFNGIPATGRTVTFTGMVIVRVENNKMVEHWSNVDVVSLLIQLGVMPAPGN